MEFCVLEFYKKNSVVLKSNFRRCWEKSECILYMSQYLRQTIVISPFLGEIQSGFFLSYSMLLFLFSRSGSFRNVFGFFLPVNRVEVVPAFQSPHAVPPSQPQLFGNPTAQLDNPDSAAATDAVNRVMQFVTSTFGGATLMDSHSVSRASPSLLRSLLCVPGGLLRDYRAVLETTLVLAELNVALRKPNLY